MIKLSIQTNFPDVKRYIDNVGKQAVYAAAVALTRTAQDVKAALREEMHYTFDRPTPYTLNSLFLKPARRNNLEAVVWLKDFVGGMRVPHYLLPNIYGGERPLKRFELLLQRAGFLKGEERLVPASGARLDGYGNVSRGQLVQILSQLKAFRTVGGTNQNASGSRRSTAKRRQQRIFFSAGRGVVSRGGGSWWNGGEGKAQHLPRGIWAQVDGRIAPLFLVARSVAYKRIFDFDAIAERTASARFPRHFEVEFAKALKGAR